jgi:hypothetical protein
MNPRAEAYERLGGRYEVRVLEPSPPAVADPPWFADEPVARGHVPAGRKLVSPVGTGDLPVGTGDLPLGTGDLRWEELATGNPALHARRLWNAVLCG